MHDYVTINGSKISKSLGNTIDPIELVERYGTDALRYYLLREISATEDGDFTGERFIRAYNGDLADQLGNLLNRVVSMISRYYGGIVPAPGPLEEVDRRLIGTAQSLRGHVESALACFALHEALDAIWDLIGAANKYVADVEPWTLAKLRQSAGEGRHAGARLSTVCIILWRYFAWRRITALHAFRPPREKLRTTWASASPLVDPHVVLLSKQKNRVGVAIQPQRKCNPAAYCSPSSPYQNAIKSDQRKWEWSRVEGSLCLVQKSDAHSYPFRGKSTMENTLIDPF